MARELGRPSDPRPHGPGEELHREKLRLARLSGGQSFPSNVDWVEGLPTDQRRAWEGRVLRKPSRSLSGVSVVAVMTSPARCPHGRCTYCPGGVDLGSPQSYTGEEPSALRGAQLGFDARAITEQRLTTLERTGHPTSKVEVIVMGGTFPSRPKAYRDSVFQGVYEGLNGRRSPTLRHALALNEVAERRMVGLTVETRPDWCDARVLPDLLDAGVTRVEIGVECLTEKVLERVHRAHDVGDVARATREARDRGLKVVYHLMLGLPGMSPEQDLADFRRVFDAPEFRPDMLKLYPTLVLPGTPLYDEWKRGEYRPYDTAMAARLLADLKEHLPPWVRIQRIQRDIPSRLIADGVRASNLRELALAELRARGRRCPCLRCREVGRLASPDAPAFRLVETSYEAAGGREHFLAFEDPSSTAVAGFLRLRIPSGTTDGGATAPVIRELKVLGPELPVGAKVRAESYQHRGFGRALIARAQEIAASSGAERLLVLSAVGTRPYYRRLGFSGDGPLLEKPCFA